MIRYLKSLLCAALLWSVPVAFCQCPFFDISTTFPGCIPNPLFPPVNSHTCFSREVSPDECFPSQCTLSPLPQSVGDIVFKRDLTQIATPNFYIEGGLYPDNIHCQYHIDTCPIGTVGYVRWSSPNFMVEAPLLTPFGSVCQDHVNIFFMDLTNQGLVMDVFNVLCGSQPSFQKEAEQSLQVEFRSGTTGQHKGVLIDFLCAQVEFSPAANSVQRRAAFYGPSSEEGLPDVVTEENCTTVGDFTQVPVQKGPVYVAQTGNKLIVPRTAFIKYQRNILRVVQNKRVLRTFFRIRRFFFWTQFNGTRVFITSANVPRDEIFGGGRLLIIKDCAYYINFKIPLKFVPNCREKEVMSRILDGVTPFFADQNINIPLSPGPNHRGTEYTYGHPGPRPNYKVPPTNGPPGPRPPYRTTPLPEERSTYGPTTPYTKIPPYGQPRTHPAPNTYPPPTKSPPKTKPGLDPRVNVIALKLAFQFENACNIFLRQVSRSYLGILQDEGILNVKDMGKH